MAALTAIAGAHVLTMDPALGEIPGGTVLIDGPTIASVGPEPPPQGAARVVDGRGCALLPGLVNCHNHAAMALLRGHGADLPLMRWLQEAIWPAEERLTGEDVYWGTLLACAEMLRAGTTAFADMYFWMDDAARAVAESGMRGVLSRGMAGRSLEEAADFCRRWQGGAEGRVTTMIAPHAEYTCPEPFLREAAAAARELGVPVHVHASETAGEVAACRERHGGRSPVRVLADCGLFDGPALAAHCVHVDAGDIALLAERGVAVAHNPVSNCKLASGVAPVEALLSGGVTVGVGTDGPASTDALGMWEELRLAGWLAKVRGGDAAALPARRILEMATRDGARALGLGEACGRIAPGLRADLVLVRLDGPHLTPHPDLPAGLVYSARDADVDSVWVDGRLLVRGGEVLSVDLQRARAEVTARAARLLRA
jgi:5-methylthioadenosine/S-adenosylhomocysteine deaminase